MTARSRRLNGPISSCIYHISIALARSVDSVPRHVSTVTLARRTPTVVSVNADSERTLGKPSTLVPVQVFGFAMTATPTPQSHPLASTFAQQSVYEASTQYRHWRFSPEELFSMRSILNANAVLAIRNAFENDSVSIVIICS